MRYATHWTRLHCALLCGVGLLLLVFPDGAWLSRSLSHPLLPSSGPWPRMLGLQMAMMGMYLWVVTSTGDQRVLRWCIALRSLLFFSYGTVFWKMPSSLLRVLMAFEASWLLGFFVCSKSTGSVEERKKDARPSTFTRPSWLHQLGLGAFPFVEGIACLCCLGLWSEMTFAMSPPQQVGWAQLFGLQSCYLGCFWFVMVSYRRLEGLYATLFGRAVVALAFFGFVWGGVVPRSSRFLLLGVMLLCSAAWSWLELTGRLHLDRRRWDGLRDDKS